MLRITSHYLLTTYMCQHLSYVISNLTKAYKIGRAKTATGLTGVIFAL